MQHLTKLKSNVSLVITLEKNGKGDLSTILREKMAGLLLG